MSEHIKTGVEIWGEIKDISKNPATTIKELSEQCFDKKILQKWISLSWLKEQIQERKKEIDRWIIVQTKEVHIESLERAKQSLDWLLSIFEEKKVK